MVSNLYSFEVVCLCKVLKLYFNSVFFLLQFFNLHSFEVVHLCKDLNLSV